MVVLGIVLIVLAVLFGLGVSVSSSDSTTMEVFGVDFGVLVPTVFFLGAVAGIALVAGLWLAKKGLGRGYRRRQEMKQLRARAATNGTATSEPDTAAGPSSDSTTEPVGGTGDRRSGADEWAAPDVEPGPDEPSPARDTVADSTETQPPR